MALLLKWITVCVTLQKKRNPELAVKSAPPLVPLLGPALPRLRVLCRLSRSTDLVRCTRAPTPCCAAIAHPCRAGRADAALAVPAAALQVQIELYSLPDAEI